jgi:hypothetical protein
MIRYSVTKAGLVWRWRTQNGLSGWALSRDTAKVRALEAIHRQNASRSTMLLLAAPRSEPAGAEQLRGGPADLEHAPVNLVRSGDPV